MVGSLLTTTAPAAAADTYAELIADPELHENHSQVLRLYQAVLNRTPELDGAEFWLRQYDLGEWNTRRIANFFVNSEEFEAVFGAGLNDLDFTTVIYENVLDRSPDGTGFDFWVEQLELGMARSEMVLLISNSPEFITRFPLPSDARRNTGPRYPGLGFYLDSQQTCIDHATRVGNPPPNPARYEGAQFVGPGGGSGEYIIVDGLGDRLLVSFFHASGTAVILSDNAPDYELPRDYSFGCPPELYVGDLSS